MSLFDYSKIKNMNKSEFLVYNYIVQNIETAVKKNIRQVAQEAGVSTTTVLRFCSKVGCDGFKELKFRIKQESGKYASATGNKYDIEPAVNYIQNVSDDSEFQRQISEATRLCIDARQIIFFGIKSSKILAEYGAFLFTSMNKQAFIVNELYGRPCVDDLRDSLLFIISVSGNEQKVVDYVNEYKKKGAKTISITNTSDCTLGKMTDLNFAYYMPCVVLNRGKGNVSLTTQLPVVYLLELLAGRISSGFDY